MPYQTCIDHMLQHYDLRVSAFVSLRSFLLLTNSWRGCRGRHHKSRSWLLSLALVSSFSRPSITQFLPARGWRMTTSLKEVTGLMHLWIISHYYSSVPTYNVSSFIALSALGTYPRDFFESPAFLPLLAPPFSRLSYYYQQCIFWPTISHALDWIWKARRALKIKHIVQW